MSPLTADKAVCIRIEDPTGAGEHQAIRAVNEAAFGRTQEADLVDKLRGDHAIISLVAEGEPGIVGHVLFSRMWIENAADRAPAVALAPVAVLPEYQSKGIGCYEHRPTAVIRYSDDPTVPRHDGTTSEPSMLS